MFDLLNKAIDFVVWVWEKIPPLWRKRVVVPGLILFGITITLVAVDSLLTSLIKRDIETRVRSFYAATAGGGDKCLDAFEMLTEELRCPDRCRGEVQPDDELTCSFRCDPGRFCSGYKNDRTSAIVGIETIPRSVATRDRLIEGIDRWWSRYWPREGDERVVRVQVNIESYMSSSDSCTDCVSRSRECLFQYCASLLPTRASGTPDSFFNQFRVVDWKLRFVARDWLIASRSVLIVGHYPHGVAGSWGVPLDPVLGK